MVGGGLFLFIEVNIMKELVISKNEEAEINEILDEIEQEFNNEQMVRAVDLARSLGYKNPKQAVQDVINNYPEYFKGVSVGLTPSSGGKQKSVIFTNREAIYFVAVSRNSDNKLEILSDIVSKLEQTQKELDQLTLKLIQETEAKNELFDQLNELTTMINDGCSVSELTDYIHYNIRKPKLISDNTKKKYSSQAEMDDAVAKILMSL